MQVAKIKLQKFGEGAFFRHSRMLFSGNPDEV
jgi:hypothetical protein